MKEENKIKMKVLEQIKLLFPFSKEPIAIASAIELTFKEVFNSDTIQKEIEDKCLIAFNKGRQEAINEFEKIIDDTYREHNHLCNHPFIFLIKKKIKEMK